MSLEIVNGYVCRSCGDVSLAKRNIDPAHPHDPRGAGASQGAPATRAPDRGPAVTFAGVLQAVLATQGPSSAPAADLRPGRVLNLSI